MKIVEKGHIVKGKLLAVNRNGMLESVSHLKDGPVNIIIDTDVHNKTKNQRGYYWAVLVPHTLMILRDVCGMVEWKERTTEDAHEFLKYMFNPVFVPDLESGEEIRLPGSTKGMKKEQAINYIDSVILWAWDKFNYTMPAPKRKEDKYYFSS